jgi:hypothetical protein
MRRRGALVLALALSCGCEARSEIAPRVPVNAQVVEHEKMQRSPSGGPDIRDGFAQVAMPSYAFSGPSLPPRRTVSLGFIGDEPLGRFDPPPAQAPLEPPEPCTCAATFTLPSRWGVPAP